MSPSDHVFHHDAKGLGGGPVALAFHASVRAKLKAAELAGLPESDMNISERTRKVISFLKSPDTMRDSTGESLIYTYKIALGSDDETQPISNCSERRSGRFTKYQEFDEKTPLVSNRTSEQSPSAPKNSRSRRVRFEVSDAADTKNGVKEHIMGPLLRPASDMTPEEKQDVWWEQSDLAAFRKKITLASSELNRSSEILPGSYSATLKKAYQACCSANTKQSVKDDQDILNFREKLELVSWTRVSASRRGLEYKAIPCLTEELKKNRESNLSVIQLQQKLDNARIWDNKLRSDTLRVFSEKRTKTAKFFARVMAQADAEAIIELPSDSPSTENKTASGTTTRRYTM